MKKLIAFVSFLGLLVASPSFGGTTAPSIKTDQGKAYLMCNSSVTSGAVCDMGSGDVYAIVSGYDSLTFIMAGDKGSGATCEAYGVGHYDEDGVAVSMNGTADLSTLSADTLFSASLTITQSRITLANTDFYAVFMICTDASTPGSMDTVVELRGSFKDWDNN